MVVFLRDSPTVTERDTLDNDQVGFFALTSVNLENTGILASRDIPSISNIPGCIFASAQLL